MSRSNLLLLVVAVVVCCCCGFVSNPAPMSYKVRTLLKLSEDSGSSMNTKQTGKVGDKSPLLDRALDSALDFLQDAEGNNDDDEDDEFDMFEVYADSPDFDIPYELIAELEEKERLIAENKGTSALELNTATIKAAVAKWRKHESDCGSAEVQIAIAHEKIKYLTSHLLVNKKDQSAKRGLQAIVATRRKFLNYLYQHDKQKAEQMISEMGIRFRPPGRAYDKETKYGAFRNTKKKMTKFGKLKTSVV